MFSDGCTVAKISRARILYKPNKFSPTEKNPTEIKNQKAFSVGLCAGQARSQVIEEDTPRSSSHR
jgi:hypothetical protein